MKYRLKFLAHGTFKNTIKVSHSNANDNNGYDNDYYNFEKHKLRRFPATS